jgi:hypothetical protein
MGKCKRDVIAAVFCVRHIDINNAIEQPEGFDSIVSATVIDNRDMKTLVCCNPDRSHHLRDDMRRRYDIDVMATLLLEADHHARHMFTGYLAAPAALTDVMVLAVFARKVAVGDKDGT